MQVTKAFKLIKSKGVRFCAYRLGYAAQRKTGVLKRKFPAYSWCDIQLSDWLHSDFANESASKASPMMQHSGTFFFDKGYLPKSETFETDSLIHNAEKILNDTFQYFFCDWKSLGQTPNWFLNPFTGTRGDSQSHWCDINLLDSQIGDIKLIWEPSRFAWAYTLARAYSCTADERYVRKFLDLFESWLEHNPPNKGVNYACGQECAIRLMAMCFALFALENSPAFTEQNRERIIKAIFQHADRIEKNISYAISTKTNHSITEAAGLYTVGLLFPQCKRANHWRTYGKKILIREGRKQIYPDGSYIQHSLNYHRLMLQDYIWVLRLAELNHDTFPAELTNRVKKAVDLIYQLQDPSTGRVPNYGANDGALIIPLNNCEYLDYRPIIQAGYYLFYKKRLFEPGPWDEDLLWLFGKEALESKTETLERKNLSAKNGGYYTIRRKKGWAMMRCHTFKDRPAHADMLHLDLWWNGINFLRDSGSYLYNTEEKWQEYFMGTTAHNTVCVDGLGQMEKGPLWNWYGWTKSRFLGAIENPQENIQSIAGEHYGYKKLGENITHKRTVYSIHDYWVIVDDIAGTGKHRAELYWQLNDCDISQVENGFVLNQSGNTMYISLLSDKPIHSMDLRKGDTDIPAGFQSLYYGQMKPTPVLKIQIEDDLPIKIITLVSCGKKIHDPNWDTPNNQLTWTEAETLKGHELKL